LKLFNNKYITDEGLKNLPKTLLNLDLSCNNNITDEGLKHLPNILKYLYL
jgi:hypothetical protein